jgi:hypothetical protein
MATAKTATKSTETEAAESAQTERDMPIIDLTKPQRPAPKAELSDSVVIFYNPQMDPNINVTDVTALLPYTAAAGVDKQGNKQTQTLYERSTIYPGLQVMPRKTWERWLESPGVLEKTAIDKEIIRKVMDDPSEITEFGRAERVGLIQNCLHPESAPLLEAWSKLLTEPDMKQQIDAQAKRIGKPGMFDALTQFAAS